MRRLRVLWIAPWWQPAVMAGPMVRALANMLDAVGPYFRVSVITSDRDAGASEPYRGIPSGRWLTHDTHRIMHLAPEAASYVSVAREVRREMWTAIHVSGVFSPLFSSWPLAVVKSRRRRPRMIVQPHGELAADQLATDARRKQLTLATARRLGLYRDVVWHATSEPEAAEIRAAIGDGARIQVAANAPDHRELDPEVDPVVKALCHVFYS